MSARAGALADRINGIDGIDNNGNSLIDEAGEVGFFGYTATMTPGLQIALGGAVTNGDLWKLALGGVAASYDYPVANFDTLANVAAGLAAVINGRPAEARRPPPRGRAAASPARG